MLKIDDFNNSKNEDMDCLENILASDNNYTNSIVGFNKLSTVYNTNVNVEIEQPVSEIRQEFISDDIVKAVKYIKSNDMESLNVKFNPKDLGEISINISKNNEESNLLITVDDNNVFDFVNKNIEDIKYYISKHKNPLALYVFSENKAFSEDVITRFSFGGGCVNDTISHVASNYLPFGGIGSSGMGSYHGKSSFDTFTHSKSIVKKSTKLNIKLVFPPYKNRINIIKKVMK